MTTPRSASPRVNIRNIHTASNLYENDHKGSSSPQLRRTCRWSRQFHGPVSRQRPQSISGLDGIGPATRVAPGGKRRSPGIQPCEADGGLHYFAYPEKIVPYCFGEGLTTSTRGFGRVGTWQFPNSRQVAEYMEDKCYHKTYFAPKGPNPAACGSSSAGTATAPCARRHSPMAQAWHAGHPVHPAALELLVLARTPFSPLLTACPTDKQPTDAFSDPMSVPAGFRTSTAAQGQSTRA